MNIYRAYLTKQRAKLKLSSIILVKNEENNIKRCLESQIGIIDEIIVLLDSESSDNSENIIRSFPGVRCETVVWQGYAKTKSSGLNFVTNDWVFWIDADETLTEELKKEILIFKESVPEYPAYMVPRKAFFLGKWIKHSGWYPGYVTRLFDKTRVKFNENEVHEGLDVNGETGKLKHPLNHYTDPSIEHYYFKFNKYTSLAAKEINGKNKQTGVFAAFIRAISVFIKMYILKLGFLDGSHGFTLAVFSSNYVFTKYCKVWEKSLPKGDLK